MHVGPPRPTPSTTSNFSLKTQKKLSAEKFQEGLKQLSSGFWITKIDID